MEDISGELPHLDMRLLESPSFALEGAVKEVVRMERWLCSIWKQLLTRCGPEIRTSGQRFQKKKL